jgi:hypothetical protein
MSPLPRLVEGAVVADLPDGEVVASLADRSMAVVLNPTAGAILALCDGTRSVDEIVGFLCANLSASDPATVKNDVARLLDQLSGAGLLA